METQTSKFSIESVVPIGDNPGLKPGGPGGGAQNNRRYSMVSRCRLIPTFIPDPEMIVVGPESRKHPGPEMQRTAAILPMRNRAPPGRYISRGFEPGMLGRLGYREGKGEKSGNRRVPSRPDRPAPPRRVVSSLSRAFEGVSEESVANSQSKLQSLRRTVEMHCLFVCFGLGSVLPVLSLSRLCCRQIVLFRPAASLFFRIQLVNSLSKAKVKTAAGRGIDGVVNSVGRGRRRSGAPAKEGEEEVEEHTRRA
ncbi:unnamed protein product [Calypogeia fissa]